jgi:LysR family transcriptional regulator, chromosome initiation inhibitor
MLNHKQCEAFLAVAETGSFDLAAERLCLTASAITLRVQQLEKYLGHVLIVRERPCRVTTSGQSLLHYLQHRRLLEDQLLQQLTGQSKGHDFYQLNIATNDDSLATWLLSTLQEVLLEEKIVLHLQVDDQSQTHRLLEAGRVNACISTEVQAMKGCQAIPINTMTYHLVATPDFVERWFKHGLTRDSVKQAPAVIYNAKDTLHTDLIQQYFGLNPQSYPHHYIPSSTSFVDAILLGLGFGMLPDAQIGTRLETGELINLLPQYRHELKLYWHHWNQQSKQLQKLTSVLQAYADDHA